MGDHDFPEEDMREKSRRERKGKDNMNEEVKGMDEKQSRPAGAEAAESIKPSVSEDKTESTIPEDKTESPQNQELDWDAELKALAGKDAKAKKFFAGFATFAQVQVYEGIIRELNNLSDPALRCLLFIARQTVGWGKTHDWISVSQFSKGIRGQGDEPYFRGVGKGKDAILLGLKELQRNGYINKRVVCPSCQRDVPQISKTTKRGVKRKQVQARCPHCHAELLGKERIYYGLRFRPGAKIDRGVSENQNQGVSENQNHKYQIPIIKNHHPDPGGVRKSNPQVSKTNPDDDDKKALAKEKNRTEKAKASQEHPVIKGRSSRVKEASHIELTEGARMVLESFYGAFGRRKNQSRYAADLNDTVGVFGVEAFRDEIRKVEELHIRPSSVRYIIECVLNSWDGKCIPCDGYGLSNRTPDCKCPFCRGEGRLKDFEELKSALSRLETEKR